jgi:hypothetical protein
MLLHLTKNPNDQIQTYLFPVIIAPVKKREISK